MRDTAARGSPNVDVFIGVSCYLREPGLDSFLPKSTSYGLGVGRQESNTPPSPSPLKQGGRKYGALCCVQCRLINFVSWLLAGRKSDHLVRSSQSTMGLVTKQVTAADILFYKPVLQWQEEKETHMESNDVSFLFFSFSSMTVVPWDMFFLFF